ncbi:hypothetical protein KIPB_009197 [Kipferlia bialata]|uniref:Uncharacterized protein n=1 Tax=Kipferlia bialata TaxID=797122 RepID=A0A391NP22_9EUKA|nr:hypothetical protein KIPB_009197 [Kipferlia bialata]|eukprot:g9197.t1
MGPSAQAIELRNRPWYYDVQTSVPSDPEATPYIRAMASLGQSKVLACHGRCVRTGEYCGCSVWSVLTLLPSGAVQRESIPGPDVDNDAHVDLVRVGSIVYAVVTLQASRDSTRVEVLSSGATCFHPQYNFYLKHTWANQIHAYAMDVGCWAEVKGAVPGRGKFACGCVGGRLAIAGGVEEEDVVLYPEGKRCNYRKWCQDISLLDADTGRWDIIPLVGRQTVPAVSGEFVVEGPCHVCPAMDEGSSGGSLLLFEQTSRNRPDPQRYGAEIQRVSADGTYQVEPVSGDLGPGVRDRYEPLKCTGVQVGSHTVWFRTGCGPYDGLARECSVTLYDTVSGEVTPLAPLPLREHVEVACMVDDTTMFVVMNGRRLRVVSVDLELAGVNDSLTQ